MCGAGCNGCYMERADRVAHWETAHAGRDVCVDIEWGAFGDNGCLHFLRTDMDDEVDDNSLLAKSFTSVPTLHLHLLDPLNLPHGCVTASRLNSRPGEHLNEVFCAVPFL